MFMKLVLFATALVMSGAALAQTETETTMTTTTTTTTTGMTIAPSNAAPERDARGIPVISDPAEAPAGVNAPPVVIPGAQVVPNPNQAAAFQTQPATESYPACSRTVTDNCLQAYERPR
jgi:hypothetical protein